MLPTLSSKSAVSSGNVALSQSMGSSKATDAYPDTTTMLTQLLSKKSIWRADSNEPSDCVRSFSNSESEYVHNSAPATEAIPFRVPEIDDLLPERGLARKTVHEIFYKDPLQPQAVACTLSTIIAFNSYISSRALTHASYWHNSSYKDVPYPSIVWIGSRCWPSPLALSSYCIKSYSHFLQHCLFIDPPNDKAMLWAIETALRSHAVQLVIACCPRISRPTTQRLALAARNNNSTAILLRHTDDIKAPSHALSRWEVAPAQSYNNLPSWNLTLCKLPGLSAQKYSWHISLKDSWGAPRSYVSNQELLDPLHAVRIDAHATETSHMQSAHSKQRAAGLSL